MTSERMWEAWAGTGSKAKRLSRGEAKSAAGWGRGGEFPQGRDAKPGLFYRGLKVCRSP